MNKKGFTLIEIIIVIGIITILASAAIVAIKPGQQFAVARDTIRSQPLSNLYSLLISYQVSNKGRVQLVAENTETRFIGIGTTEAEYND